MRRLLPSQLEDYKAEGKEEFYDRQTAFKYMDGAAELYRAYAFSLLMVRKYVKEGHPAIVVELYDMGASEDAFGIFSYQTPEEEVGIGQGSDYGGGLLRFWKGRYFVSLFAEKETATTKVELLKIGRAIAKKIKEEGTLPTLIQYLPEGGLTKNAIRYFRHPQILNHHYFLAHENLLGLGEKTPAVLAPYLLGGEKDRAFLLLIQYPGRRQAENALKRFMKAYMPEAPPTQTVKTENGKWTSATLTERYLLIVFDAPSQEKAETLIESAQNRLKRGRP
ncbi:MAG: hypothetical protein N3G78_12030 [Desulfobacterota bacterium]|nr:hypothetical protein [Thermodesulfobacteriota bacterium]